MKSVNINVKGRWFLKKGTSKTPFGMTMPGRSYNAHTSRHGFTGHEKESDLAEGIYTTEYRLYDARVGRWLSVDPLSMDNAGESPYLYCSGMPMTYFDPDGRQFVPGVTSTGKTTSENDFMVLMDGINILTEQGGEFAEKLKELRDDPNVEICLFMDMSHSGDNKFGFHSGYYGTRPFVIWDPETAAITDKGYILSPIVLFAHELQHAYDKIKRNSFYWKYKDGSTDLTKQGLETSAVKTETDVAKLFGLIPLEENMSRCEYEIGLVEHFKVASPTSIIPKSDLNNHIIKIDVQPSIKIGDCKIQINLNNK